MSLEAVWDNAISWIAVMFFKAVVLAFTFALFFGITRMALGV